MYGCSHTPVPKVSTQTRQRAFSRPLPLPQDSPDNKTYYWKVHGKWQALLEGAERIGLRMPISVSLPSMSTSEGYP